MRASDRFLWAFIVNIGAFLVNAGLFAIWVHQGTFPAAVINATFGTFSFILAMAMLNKHLDAKFKEDMEDTYRRIYGR